MLAALRSSQDRDATFEHMQQSSNNESPYTIHVDSSINILGMHHVT